MPIRDKLHEIIFGTETKAGRQFDLILLWLILISVLIVMLESINPFREAYPELFYFAEWTLTIIFTLEYILRIYVNRKPLKYIFSFWGVIDLIAIAPTYLSLIALGANSLLIIRVVRLLRVFRILKLGRYLGEAEVLAKALKASYHKIAIFFGVVLTVVTIMGTLMYLFEGGSNGFESIPQSIYWAIVTITTVGFGDIVPTTALGKILSSFVMIIGYAIIAVPTGIVTVELGKASTSSKKLKCSNCDFEEQDTAAKYCKMCGERL